MNITQDVVRDLLPAYYSGESSADTQAVIEEYLRLNPTFAIEARNIAKIFQSMGERTAPDSALEKITLKRAKRILLGQKILFSAATTFAANAIALQFSFEVGKGGVRVHWLTLPGQLVTVLALAAISAALWGWYFYMTRRVRIHILG